MGFVGNSQMIDLYESSNMTFFYSNEDKCPNERLIKQSLCWVADTLCVDLAFVYDYLKMNFCLDVINYTLR